MFKTTNFPATWSSIRDMWLDIGEPSQFTLARNTTVKVTMDDEDFPTFEVFLHGSKIVTLEPWLITYTMAGRPTYLTKQRVNRFLSSHQLGSVNNTQQNGLTGHHGGPIGDYEEVKVYHDVE